MRTVEEIERADRTLAKDLKAMLADKECYGEMTGYQVTTVDFLADVLDGISDKRLAEICAAEKDGRCVVLPCGVGDTIYVNDPYWGDACKGTVDEICYDGQWRCKTVAKSSLVGRDFQAYYNFSAFGKTVFLTRTEAEAAQAREGGT